MVARCLSALLTALVVVALVPLTAAGQATTTGADTWTPPRTADGQPDLQGVWASDSATPLERPTALADKPVLSDEDVATLQRRAAELFNGETDAAFGDSVFLAALADRQDFRSTDGVTPRTPEGTGNYNQFWLIGRWFDNRTSLIVDPPDGRIPPLTAGEERRRQASPAARRAGFPGGPEDLARGLRCLGGRVPMTGRGYNSNYQIIQTPGYVAIVMEMMHNVRIVPLDQRPYLSPDFRESLGDSRGRWEGDTLVVETRNFADSGNFSGASGNLHLIERFTRLDRDTLQYEFTMNDPTTWTSPWTAQIYMKPAPGTGEIYEFACHEGNYAVPNTLSGAREQEKADR